MVKYIKEDTSVVFSEIPDEITLAINISNCPHHCKGCHSPYLREDIGEELTEEELSKLIKEHDGVTCVCFMGEGKDLDTLFNLGLFIKNNYNLKVGIYSGSDDVPLKFWYDFDYIKVGGYKEDKGPIDNPNTNQRMYTKTKEGIKDITSKFWNKTKM